jgi:hypothetical protein
MTLTIVAVIDPMKFRENGQLFHMSLASPKRLGVDCFDFSSGHAKALLSCVDETPTDQRELKTAKSGPRHSITPSDVRCHTGIWYGNLESGLK